MENVISRTKEGSLADVVKGMETFASEQTRKLLGLFKAMLAYEREKIHLGNPSAEEEKQFVEVAKQLREAAQVMMKWASRTDADELEWVVDRLKLSIEILENPMTEKEADEFLAKHFPG
jgi:t-SNARE complex subunit (syntaxin)